MVFKHNFDSNKKIHIDSIIIENRDNSKPIKAKANSYYGVNEEVVADRNIDFSPPEYDLSLLSTIKDIESLFQQFVEKIIQRMFKQDISLIGDEDAVNYINNRISYLSSYTNDTFRKFLEDLARDLIYFNNVFLEKVRNKKAPLSYWRNTIDGKLIPPVVTYNRIDPPLMRIAGTKKGRIIKYLQALSREEDINFMYFNEEHERYPKWDPIDIIHGYVNKKANTFFGSPTLIPVIDDVRALRVMEEACEILIFQYAKPILLYKLNAENLGKRVTSEEDMINAENVLNNMPSHGYLILPPGHNAEYIGARDSFIDPTPILTYFRDRIWVGMGIDPITMGMGGTANRNTAQSLSESMIYLVSYYQTILKEIVEYQIFREWLIEGKKIGKVEIYFPEIDFITKQNKETHASFMYNSNIIGLTEARKDIGRKDEPDNKDLYTDRVRLYSAEEEAKINSKYTTKDVSSSNMVKYNSRGKEAESRVHPTNQHGTTYKPKIKKDSYENEEFYTDEDNFKEEVNNGYKIIR